MIEKHVEIVGHAHQGHSDCAAHHAEAHEKFQVHAVRNMAGDKETQRVEAWHHKNTVIRTERVPRSSCKADATHRGTA